MKCRKSVSGSGAGVKIVFPNSTERSHQRSMKRGRAAGRRRRRRRAAWVRRAAAAARAQGGGRPLRRRASPARSPGAAERRQQPSSGRGVSRRRAPSKDAAATLLPPRCAHSAAQPGDGGGGGGVPANNLGDAAGKVACCGLRRDGLWRWVGDHCGRGPADSPEATMCSSSLLWESQRPPPRRSPRWGRFSQPATEVGTSN